jgi:hypothetical protein
MHNTDAGLPGSAVPGDVAPAPGSSGAASPRVSKLYQPGSPSFPPSLINWRWVEDVAKSTYSQVTTTETLLHDTLASVDQNILRPIRVSLKREQNLARIPLTSSTPSHPHLCFVSVALVPGQ